jgi:hypothetical protein
VYGIADAIDTVATRVSARASTRVAALNDWQRHRGPDNDVVVTVRACTFRNSRRATQDPSPAGNQSFVSGGGRYHCVFDDEISNCRRLIKRYQLPMHTGCDGEVISVLFAKLGMDLLAELGGNYAIALVDSLEERLYLTRDPFGIKPLYWRTIPDGSMAFACAVQPLARLAPGVRLDSLAVACYLYLGVMALAGARSGPGEAAICAGPADSYLGKLAARPKRGFRVPMSRWLTESFAPVFDAVSVPDAVVWTVPDRTAAERPGLLSGSGVRTRPAETWVLAALNAWIETVSPGPGRR